MSILYTSDPARGAVFADIFAAEAPELAFHSGTAPDPAAVEYMITWTAPDLRAYPSLRLLFSTGAGVDQFDLTALPAGAQVVRMLEPGIAEQMCEYVTLAVLGLHRGLPGYLNQQRAAQWKIGTDHPAAKRRVGVMGLGQLGKAVLQALAPFGFPLAGWARSPRRIDGVEVFTDLDAFLARTDILICLMPLTTETGGMLDAKLFAALPQGAMLVQVGRGRQTDQEALLAALDSGQLSAAWLDVTEPEPLPPEHPLWSHPRVILTPHIASRTRAEDGARFVLEAIRAHRAGQRVPGLVDRIRGY
ncbi:2-hydroxyacid dehydrogenase [Pararhodobacter sp.]|uniref:2-hydroxyacid dehydrogenase n=1 Tax=Pararhodobacter sp. TaxID=2127056 RepID=UPI002FDCB924